MNFHGCNPNDDGVRTSDCSSAAQSSGAIFRAGSNFYTAKRQGIWARSATGFSVFTPRATRKWRSATSKMRCKTGGESDATGALERSILRVRSGSAFRSDLCARCPDPVFERDLFADVLRTLRGGFHECVKLQRSVLIRLPDTLRRTDSLEGRKAGKMCRKRSFSAFLPSKSALCQATGYAGLISGLWPESRCTRFQSRPIGFVWQKPTCGQPCACRSR
jgi:hypothetical protein